MILQEIAQYLADNGVGTLGTDFFVGELPPEPDNAIMVMSGSSDEPDRYLDTQYLSLDVWSRNKVTPDGYTKLNLVFALLHQKQNYSLPNYHVYFSHATGNIEDFDRDINGRKLHKLTLRFIYQNETGIS